MKMKVELYQLIILFLKQNWIGCMSVITSKVYYMTFGLL